MSPAQAQAIPLAIDIGPKLAGDGSRYVAYNRTDGVPLVFDAKKGKVRAIRGANGCTPVDVGAGRVLLDCSDQFEAFKPARVASVRGGRSYRARGSTRRTDLTEIGRYWMRGYPICPSACSSIIYINRASGARRSFSSGDRSTGSHSLLSSLDLDLNRKSLRLRPHPGFLPPLRSWSVLDYRRHFYLVDSGGLRIWRSATSSARIGGSIGAGFGNSRGLGVGSGRITWIKKSSLRSFELDSRRKSTRRLSGPGARVSPVKQGAVVAAPIAVVDKPTRYRISIARLG